MKKVCFFGLLA